MDRAPKYGYQFIAQARRFVHKNGGGRGGALMQWRGGRRMRGASRCCLSRAAGVLAIAALAGSAAGCSSLLSDGRASLASASSSGSTLAFESIDGPPPDVFRKLVANLNEEAGARQIAVVSRTGAATYRVRGYVSAVVERDKTTFAWVWDVYDIDKRRTLRISGEEPAVPGRRRDAWSAADEKVLRRMAHDGMDRIAGFLNSAEPPPAAPEPSLVTLVSGRDDSPEGAGIFRVFSSPDQPAGAPEAATDKPLPPKAAKSRAKTRSTAAAPKIHAAALASSTDGLSPGR
jgi:hypothetical protein